MEVTTNVMDIFAFIFCTPELLGMQRMAHWNQWLNTHFAPFDWLTPRRALSILAFGIGFFIALPWLGEHVFYPYITHPMNETLFGWVGPLAERWFGAHFMTIVEAVSAVWTWISDVISLVLQIAGIAACISLLLLSIVKVVIAQNGLQKMFLFIGALVFLAARVLAIAVNFHHPAAG